MAFKDWIKQFDGDYSHLSDLAGDIMVDDRFPQVNDYRVIYSHLVGLGACDGALNALNSAWRLYEQDRGLHCG